jgi:hypothetical protein
LGVKKRVTTGASNEKRPVLEPFCVCTLTTSRPLGPCVAEAETQTAEVVEIHCELAQAVLPTKIVVEKSSTPKFMPDTETCADPDGGAFAEFERVTTGGSYVKKSTSVPDTPGVLA